MTFAKGFLVLWVTFLFAVGFSVFWGRSGFQALKKMEHEQERLSANIEKLKETNKNLEGKLKNLRSNPDTLTMYAQELGYAKGRDDRFIRISGIPLGVQRSTQVGNMIKVNRPKTFSDGEIRILAAIFGILVYSAIFILGHLRKGLTYKNPQGRTNSVQPW